MTSSQIDRPALIIELTGLRNHQGIIYAALFNGPDGFPSDGSKALRSARFPIAPNACTVRFEDLPFGRYAATVHHDENMDEKLNLGPLGIPKEGIGFSGNPKIWIGVPPYHRVEFEFTPANRMISIAMKYLI